MNPLIAGIPPSLIRTIAAKKRAGDIDLGLGEPVLPPDIGSFEAALQWALERDGAPVRAGQLTASAGAPARGTFTVPLGRLGAGTYTVRIWSVSPKDGAVDASDEVTFEVR